MADQPPVSFLQLAADAKRFVPQSMQQQFQANAPYVAPGDHTYNTPLAPLEEMTFRNWLNDKRVPFDASAPVSDYDMRGFYRALQAGDPRAVSAVNPNDNQMHYPDYWKTPYHQSFSQESQWAAPVAPQWINGSQLASPGARILFDERNR